MDKVNELSNFIRQIDGNHTMGAGMLAEKICEWLAAQEKNDSFIVIKKENIDPRMGKHLVNFLAAYGIPYYTCADNLAPKGE